MPALVGPVTHADQPIPVLVCVKLEDGRIEQRTGWAKAWTSSAVFIHLHGGYVGWWPAGDVNRGE